MKFSIIVAVFNTSAHLERCIEALRFLDYPPSEYDILLVDNNSTDGSAQILYKAFGDPESTSSFDCRIRIQKKRACFSVGFAGSVPWIYEQYGGSTVDI